MKQKVNSVRGSLKGIFTSFSSSRLRTLRRESELKRAQVEAELRERE